MLTKAAIFTDHMVLQRGKPIPVWGTAPAGQAVTVALGFEQKTVSADGNGRWAAVLSPREPGEPLTLTITSGAEVLTCAGVAVGEVWLAGGQSNMEMPLRDCRGGKKEMAASAGKNVRFYRVPRCAVAGEELERMEAESRWQVCAPETSGDISAVAWFFACQIAESQGVPVGIIDCCWGGTSVTCWMGRGRLEATRAGQSYLDAYAALVGGRTEAQYRREMEDYNARWQAWNDRVTAIREEAPHITWPELDRRCSPCPWPQPAGDQSPFRPGGLYETMLRRVCPYGLRGFLYYQGEEDADRYGTYGELLTGLIDQWRTDWGDVELPFLFVQLPMYCSEEEYARHEDSKHWALLRDQQWKVSRTVANTGLAVLTDCGEFGNIHPMDKRTVGVRLALQARQKVYGEPVVADGPRIRGTVRRGNCLEVRFDRTAGALTVRGNCLEGFELAGPDGVYYEARGEVRLDVVLLQAEEVPQPETVRYAWTNYGPANLYNAAGLPAAPFRTDRQRIS